MDDLTFNISFSISPWKMQCYMFHAQSSIVHDFPWLGRFLSPDPYVQSPGNSQSYNRYSYCFNNPLKYIDPSGYSAWKFEQDPIQTFGSSGDLGIFRINWNPNLSEPGSYSYDWWTGTYRNSEGEEVSYNEVFVNYVQPNSISFNSYLSSIISGNIKRSKSQGNPQNPVNHKNLLADIKEALLNQGNMMFNGTLEQLLTGDDPVVFDISKAIAYLISTAYEYSKGRCSPHVVAALIEGGLTSLEGMPIKAGGSYGPILIELGFTMISTTLDNYTFTKGDIAVINGYIGGTPCSAGPCGHIQMYTGDEHKWVSDFFQTRPFWPGQKYEDAQPYFEIYRWK